MKFCKNSLMALGGAVLFALSAASFAAPDPAMDACPMAGQGGYKGGFMVRMQKHHERMQARLHDQLKLTPEQEPAWQAFVKATPPHFPMPGMAAGGEDLSKLSAPERADKMLARLKEHEAVMAQHIEALKTFYAQLNADQKKTFDTFHAREGAWGKKAFFGRAPLRNIGVEAEPNKK